MMYLNPAIDHISQLLNPIAIKNGYEPFDSGSLESLVSLYNEDRYHTVRIPKKNSSKGFRELSIPNKRLKELLRCEYNFLLPLFKLNDSAFGFVKGKSVYGNALLHVRQKYVLNLDIHNFFPSTTSYLVYQKFSQTYTTTHK